MVSLGDTGPEKLYSYAAWVIRLLPNRQVPADIEITEDVMRLHAQDRAEEAGSASLAAGDTMPLSPIKESPRRNGCHSPCWSELGFCR